MEAELSRLAAEYYAAKVHLANLERWPSNEQWQLHIAEFEIEDARARVDSLARQIAEEATKCWRASKENSK